jgi:hypothetical protein
MDGIEVSRWLKKRARSPTLRLSGVKAPLSVFSDFLKRQSTALYAGRYNCRSVMRFSSLCAAMIKPPKKTWTYKGHREYPSALYIATKKQLRLFYRLVFS